MKQHDVRIAFLDYYSIVFVDDFIYDNMSEGKSITFSSFPKMIKALRKLTRSCYAYYYHQDPDIIFQLKLMV